MMGAACRPSQCGQREGCRGAPLKTADFRKSRILALDLFDPAGDLRFNAAKIAADPPLCNYGKAKVGPAQQQPIQIRDVDAELRLEEIDKDEILEPGREEDEPANHWAVDQRVDDDCFFGASLSRSIAEQTIDVIDNGQQKCATRVRPWDDEGKDGVDTKQSPDHTAHS